jgi:putative hydrolase of the HAD superfamily
MPNAFAISFDLGQTLVELDETFLAKQALGQGYQLQTSRAGTELSVAWQAYNHAKSQRAQGFDAWAAFMRQLLERLELSHVRDGAPASAEERERFVEFLWSEQPHRNLWRKPIAGIKELLADLARAKIQVGVLTNSEGRAKELVDEVGLGPWVNVVVDSGLEGVEKPDPRIFAIMAERLGRAPNEIIHVGDSYEADVLGALGANMTPVWFVREPTVTLPPGVLLCRSVAELRRLLLRG